MGVEESPVSRRTRRGSHDRRETSHNLRHRAGHGGHGHACGGSALDPRLCRLPSYEYAFRYGGRPDFTRTGEAEPGVDSPARQHGGVYGQSRTDQSPDCAPGFQRTKQEIDWITAPGNRQEQDPRPDPSPYLGAGHVLSRLSARHRDLCESLGGGRPGRAGSGQPHRRRLQPGRQDRAHGISSAPMASAASTMHSIAPGAAMRRSAAMAIPPWTCAPTTKRWAKACSPW